MATDKTPAYKINLSGRLRVFHTEAEFDAYIKGSDDYHEGHNVGELYTAYSQGWFDAEVQFSGDE